MRCSSCRLEFLSPQPTWEEIQNIYSAEYYASWDMKDGENQMTARLKRLTFARRLAEFRKFVQSGPILDIGTATGFFLEEVLLDRNFEPYGVEVSPYAGSIAQQKFGAGRIHIGTLETAPFQPGFFSAVAMSDLLEHVLDPRDTLRCVNRLTKPGGVVMIMTPDATSLSHGVMGSRWTHFKLEHLFYFTPASIRLLAADTGFEVLSLKRARKTMTLKYLTDQLAVYRHPILTPISGMLCGMLKRWENKPFSITMGEMVVFLRKSSVPRNHAG